MALRFPPILTALAGALCLVLATALPGQALEKVSLRLHWVHQAQFAGLYLAQDLGLYRDAGLEVDIRPGGPGRPHPLREISRGSVDFGTSWLTEAMAIRGQGVDVVHLAQLIQRSSLMVICFADRRIITPDDLVGRRVGMWRDHFAIPPRALFRRLNIEVREIDQSVSMSAFLRRAVDAATAMEYNEYHQLYQAGINFDDLRTFHFADLGLNFPEDGIYALRSTWETRPEVCRKFVQASLEGWRRAMADPEAALAASMKRVNEARLASNEAHQRWMLKVMCELITYRVGQEKMGELAAKDLALTNGVLVTQGFLNQLIIMEDFAIPAWRRP
ncbi:MAG: ABC transporter substrate-binding protein [Pseudomonadota bacterium]